MPGFNGTGKRWSDGELARLCELYDGYKRDKKRPNWNVIGKECRHPAMSCKVTMFHLRCKRHNREGRKRLAEIRATVASHLPMPEAEVIKPALFTHADHSRSTSTGKFLMDAELRARIAILGPNGLMGDPLPGRSALDRRRTAAT